MENLFNDDEIKPDTSNNTNIDQLQLSNSKNNNNLSLVTNNNEDNDILCKDIDNYLNGDCHSLGSDDNDIIDDINTIKSNKLKFNPNEIDGNNTYIGYYAAIDNREKYEKVDVNKKIVKD